MSTQPTRAITRIIAIVGTFAILAGLCDLSRGFASPWFRVPGDLEGRWKLDEGSGTSAADSSGNGNTGTLNGPVWVAGQAGQALSFDGVNDYVTLGTTSLPAANASQTVSWWMNVASVPSSVQTAIDLHGGTTSAVQTGFRSGKVTVWKQGGGVLVDTAAPSSNVWHHFAYTFDAAVRQPQRRYPRWPSNDAETPGKCGFEPRDSLVCLTKTTSSGNYIASGYEIEAPQKSSEDRGKHWIRLLRGASP